MLFNTLTYAKFFAFTFVVAWLLAPHRRLRVGFLAVMSYVFYAGWSVAYLPILALGSALDFGLGRLIEAAKSPARKKALLVLTILFNVGVLVLFKYWNFGAEVFRDAGLAAGVAVPDLHLDLPLPIGISFFTFMSLSYVVDVYRGTIPACRNPLTYLAYIAFFPHLVAGPIVRGRDLLPALERDTRLTAEAGGHGLFLIALGLVKKVVVGDWLALNLVDRVYADPTAFSALETMTALYGYAVQVYCDFSGYTDIATGSALLLGYRFPKNFDAPYQTTNIVDFWRRWHISLSSWLRDYVYIPLGGSRHGRGRKYLNVFLTMLLCGIWHGAAWSFVLFGMVHGLAVAATHAFRDLRPKLGLAPATPDPDEGAPAPITAGRLACVFATFTFVALSFILFRSESVAKAQMIAERLASLTTYHENLHPRVLAILFGTLALLWFPRSLVTKARAVFVASPAPAQAAVLFFVALALHEAASVEAVPFVYFQF